MSMSLGIKHVIRCRCILSQFRTVPRPPTHAFIAFSIIDESNNVKPKYVQCTNCGIVHKVIDIGKSEIVDNREHMASIISIDDIKASLPEKLVNILESNSVDLPTWESAQFILENNRWGDIVVLTSDVESGTRQGKFVRIIGENLFKIETFVREEIVKR